MDALFIVPALVSKNVSPKLVPSIAKLIERNILLLNASLFKEAVLMKYKKKSSVGNRFGSIMGPIKRGLHLENSDIPVMVLGNINLTEDMSDVFKFGDMRVLTEGQKNIPLFDPVTQKQKEWGVDSVGLPYGLDPFDPYNDTYFRILDMRQNLKNFDRQVDEFSKSHGLNQKREARGEKEFGQTHGLNLQKHELDLKKHNLDLTKFNREELQKKFENEIKQIELSLRTAETNSKNLKNDLERKELDIKIKKARHELDLIKHNFHQTNKAYTADLSYKFGNQFQKLDQIESPKDISFFNQISIEPTYLEIPIQYHSTRDPESEMIGKRILIGVKCVPYMVDDVTNIISLLKSTRYMGFLQKLFKKQIQRRWNLFKLFSRKTKEFWNPYRKMYYDANIDPEQGTSAIIYTPNQDELNTPEKLYKRMDPGLSKSWSTMVVLSSFDLENEDMNTFVNSYKKMSNYALGDLVITNETKESAYFCSPKMGHCQEIHYEYLKKIMNLDNILDYSNVSRQYKAF